MDTEDEFKDVTEDTDSNETYPEEVCMCDQCAISICGVRGFKTGYCGNFTSYLKPYKF